MSLQVSSISMNNNFKATTDFSLVLISDYADPVPYWSGIVSLMTIPAAQVAITARLHLHSLNEAMPIV